MAGLRLDGRHLLDYGQVIVDYDATGTLVRIGDAIVHCATSVSLAYMNKPKIYFESDKVNRWMQSVIEASIDLEALCVSPSVSWELKITTNVLQEDGQSIDALFFAIIAQLGRTYRPHVSPEMELVPVQKRKPIPIQRLCLPVSITIAWVDGVMVVDPSAEELGLAQGCYTIILNEYGEVMHVHPLQYCILQPQDIHSMYERAQIVADMIRNKL